MGFGKYADRTYRSVVRNDPDYAHWCNSVASPLAAGLRSFQTWLLQGRWFEGERYEESEEEDYYGEPDWYSNYEIMEEYPEERHVCRECEEEFPDYELNEDGYCEMCEEKASYNSDGEASLSNKEDGTELSKPTAQPSLPEERINIGNSDKIDAGDSKLSVCPVEGAGDAASLQNNGTEEGNELESKCCSDDESEQCPTSSAPSSPRGQKRARTDGSAKSIAAKPPDREVTTTNAVVSTAQQPTIVVTPPRATKRKG